MQSAKSMTYHERKFSFWFKIYSLVLYDEFNQYLIEFRISILRKRTRIFGDVTKGFRLLNFVSTSFLMGPFASLLSLFHSSTLYLPIYFSLIHPFSHYVSGLPHIHLFVNSFFPHSVIFSFFISFLSFILSLFPHSVFFISHFYHPFSLYPRLSFPSIAYSSIRSLSLFPSVRHH